MGLLEYRQQLDEIDAQIVKLFEERMSISEKVAEDKIHSGKRVLDKKREQEKLATLAGLAGSDFNKRAVRELYEQIMAISRKCQYRLMDDAASRASVYSGGFADRREDESGLSGSSRSVFRGGHEGILRGEH